MGFFKKATKSIFGSTGIGAALGFLAGGPIGALIGGTVGATQERASKKAKKAENRYINEQRAVLNSAEEKIRAQEDRQREMIRQRRIGEYRGIGRNSMLLSRPYTGSSVEGTGNRQTLG